VWFTLGFQVVFEGLISFVLGIYGSCLLSGRFVPMRAAQLFAERPYDSLFHPQDFVTFNHRAKAVSAIKAYC